MMSRLTSCKTILIFILCLFSLQAFAHSPVSSNVYRANLKSVFQQLHIDRQRNKVAVRQLEQLQNAKRNKWQTAKSESINRDVLESARLNKAVVQADLVTARQSLNDNTEKLKQIRADILKAEDQLQEARVNALDKRIELDRVTTLQSKIEYLNAYYDLIYQREIELQKSVSIATQINEVHSETVLIVSQLYYQHENNVREQALLKLTEKIQNNKARVLDRIEKYTQQMKHFKLEEREHSADAITLNIKLYAAEESLFIDDVTLSLARIHDQIADLASVPEQNLLVHELDSYLSKGMTVLMDIEHNEREIKARVDSLEKRHAILEQSFRQDFLNRSQFLHNKSIYSSLNKQYQKKLNQVLVYKKQLQARQTKIRTVMSKAIASRQGLPGFDYYDWKSLIGKVFKLPKAIFNFLSTLQDHIILAVMGLTTAGKVFLGLIALSWVCFWFFVRRFCIHSVSLLEPLRQNISANIAYGALQIIRRNLFGITLFGLMVTSLFYLSVPYKTYRTLFNLSMVWFGFRLVIGIARLSLVETMSDVSGHDVELYQRLRRAFLLGGIITGIAVLTNQLSVSYEVRDLFNRLFMFFMLAVSIILFRGRYVVGSLTSPYLEKKHAYLQKAIQLLSWLLPITIFSNAVVGLVGYVQLAWVLSYYQLMILIVLTLYVIARGFLIDFTSLVADLFIRYLQNGWLWTEAVLKPLDRVLRIVMLILAAMLLMRSFGWDKNSAVVTRISDFFTYPIVSFTGGKISLLSIIAFVILVAVVFWSARWTREFAYRWLFREIRDVGIRTSLSVFSQYTMAIVGSILTLRVLGLDFSGLSYILGGLAVGMGFGLRDFANNIVSGIMLLIERPVREGDLISVGEHEGRVLHIGIRSLTMKSWDHMEVMIPNSETFNKSFSNWTHHDSIVRTVVTIKVHRSDDPIFIKELIEEVLGDMPEVLSEPRPQVFMKELDDVLIVFNVRYFVNLEQHSRVATRSKVLFALWAKFEANNIRAPYPQQDIHLIDNKSN